MSVNQVIQTGDFTDSLSISFDLSHLEKLEEMVRMLQEMKQRQEADRVERQLAVVVGEFDESDLELAF